MSRLSVLRIAFLLLFLAVLAGCDYVERVSVDSAGGDPSGVSLDPSISGERSLRRVLVAAPTISCPATATASTTCSGATC